LAANQQKVKSCHWNLKLLKNSFFRIYPSISPPTSHDIIFLNSQVSKML
jgi:hypothetical protein